ncbi:nucleoporin NDC1 [Geosmithia morbida]|uniref:Nucleoporin NDC1 n=1 Tax=Geosmithia morbida TaxID=1094350 RepID=A0A9P5D8V1_9HYPO|nr:nucleoporin NDC1 [Geosmithia morbida]KAF4125884.1 nucleoporin NDC1 [Geosmithia morbida]
MAGIPVRRAPYKDFLQPALQRRFASTAAVLVAVSYLEALLLGRWDSLLWSWFPLGPAGFRTALIFTCGLSLLVLRIALYHVGLRTTGSGMQTLVANLSSPSTYETAFWYFFSSFLFCPIFLWSMPESANLSWVKYLSGDRAKANERTIFLACYLGICALKQSVEHFVKDVDRLNLGLTTMSGGAAGGASSLKGVVLRLPAVLGGAFHDSLVSFGIVTVVYMGLIRPFAYRWTLMVLRPFYNIPKSNLLPTSWPLDLWLAGRCMLAGTLLFVVWGAGNTAFSVFMAKEPLKNGQPLTSESKDPNGSLLSGLKSKKPSIKCFAMWELALIAQKFEARRKAIYADIDRKDGPMWAQVYAVCMDAIKSIEVRVDNYGKPPAPVQAPSQTEEPRQRFSAPLRTDPVFSPSKARSGAGSKAKEVVKILTSGSDQSSSPLAELSPLARKTWSSTKDHMLTRQQQEAMSSQNVLGQLEKLVLSAMSFGWVRALLQQEFRTELAGAVLGSPHAEAILYVSATNALCQLAVHSLGEDQFGNVHRDVPSIIRTLTSVIRKVEDFKHRFPVHWTDASNSRASPEVDQVLEAMRTGLREVVASFEPFCHDLRLTPGDLRHAKEAAAPKPNEMEERPKEKEPPAASKPRREEVVAEKRPEPRQRRQSRPEMERAR